MPFLKYDKFFYPELYNKTPKNASRNWGKIRQTIALTAVAFQCPSNVHILSECMELLANLPAKSLDSGTYRKKGPRAEPCGTPRTVSVYVLKFRNFSNDDPMLKGFIE